MSRSRDAADQINRVNSSAADATAITIDSSENVGIGTTSPNAVLTTDPESGNFSSTYNNYDGVGLFIRGNGTSGNGNYGPALVFGSCDSDTVNQDHKHAAISIVQTDTDPNQTGLAFWTHPSATAADALVNSMRITSAGNVGIGTSSPDTLLHLQKTTSGAISAGGARQGSVIKLHHEAQWEAGYNSDPTDFLGAVEFSSGDTSGSGLAGEGVRAAIRAPVEDAYNNVGLSFETGGTRAERMRLTYPGNLGLGTTSPTNYNSTTYKNISVNASVGSTMELHIGGALRAYFHAYGSFVGLGTKTNHALNFVQNDTTRATIDASGNFHVSKQTVGNDAGGTLYANGQAYFVTGAGEATLLVNNSGGSNSTNTLIQFYRNSSGVGTVTTSGASTSYNTSSDYRLKTDVQPMTGASDRVQALNPVNFEWIADGTRVDGFLAHEAATVVPEAIHGTKDAMKDEEYEISAATGEIYTPLEAAYVDEDGEEVAPTNEVIHSTDVVEPETLAEGQLWRQTTEAVMGTRSVIDPQGIDQAKLVPLLTAALQEALTKIDSLETRLTALEG